ncbi:anti-sigma factor domain-containing protein [Agromyces sp. SYSU T00266]|uniref:anti-sigma factor n=1 Tax=Agromyces zhanjiangensis TaxID=3158562 RepID=UPI00339558F3
MTDSESPARREPDDFDALLAAYALDAVTDEERAIVEARLAESPELRAELAAHREAAAALADGAGQVATPPSLKASIFDRLDDVEQVPAEPRRESAAEAVAAPGAASSAADSAAERRGPKASVAGPVERAAQRRWFQRPAAIVAAAAAAVLVIAGAVVGVNWPGPTGWGAQRSVQEIAAAPDAESVTVASADGGELTIVWSAELGRSAVRASALPDVGAESTYELWYIDEAGARPAGTFDPDDGDAYVVLDGEFTPGVVVGVTVEPAGGSEAPTTDPIVVVET